MIPPCAKKGVAVHKKGGFWAREGEKGVAVHKKGGF